MLEKRNFGPITKVFLAPLLPSAAGQKQKSNKRKLYTDGWVEFKSKRCVFLCNCAIMFTNDLPGLPSFAQRH